MYHFLFTLAYSHYAIFVAFALGALVGPLAGGYLYSAVGFFNMCVIMASFLVLCGPYIFIFTGPRGKFIIRPQDKKSPTVDEETDVIADTIDITNNDPAASNSDRQEEEDISEIEVYTQERK